MIMNTKTEMLKKRSDLLRQVRAFFYARDVIEVDTPLLSQAATPDLHLSSLKTQALVPGEGELTYYLHTSPEYPMKRLLCEGSGDIFYLGKVFRNGDLSPRHQIEFTMLEWYRLGFSMEQLIDEVIQLVNSVLPEKRAIQCLTYEQAFEQYAGLSNVFKASPQAMKACLSAHQVPEIVGVDEGDAQLWEQLILTEVIEPKLGQDEITVLTHFPAREAALANLSKDNPETAERFEVFVNGLELANGYDELAKAELYRSRFEASLSARLQSNLPSVPLDENLLEILTTKPLPPCSGVALGLDRLFMLQQGENQIESVLPFNALNA